MPRYRVVSNYGELTVYKEVEAASEHDAWTMTGCEVALEEAGFTVEVAEPEYQVIPIQGGD